MILSKFQKVGVLFKGDLNPATALAHTKVFGSFLSLVVLFGNYFTSSKMSFLMGNSSHLSGILSMIICFRLFELIRLELNRRKLSSWKNLSGVWILMVKSFLVWMPIHLLVHEFDTSFLGEALIKVTDYNHCVYSNL